MADVKTKIYQRMPKAAFPGVEKFVDYLVDTLFTMNTGTAVASTYTPEYVGQLYYDTDGSTAHLAIGTTSTGWKTLNPT